MRNKIAYLTPDIPVISEETVTIGIKNQNKTFWLIDPIDGTKAYIKKKDEYTLNAALIINLKLAVGIIYAPEKDRLFFSYGKCLAFEVNNGEKKILNCKKINMSSSLKFCVISAGEADIYAANARAFEWDIAAGHAILEHAGGFVTTHEEKKILYGKKDYKNLPIIAKRSLILEK